MYKNVRHKCLFSCNIVTAFSVLLVNLYECKIKFMQYLIPVLIYFFQRTTKIYVGNLPENADNTELQEMFEKYGEVKECDIVKNYAFVVSHNCISMLLFDKCCIC